MQHRGRNPAIAWVAVGLLLLAALALILILLNRPESRAYRDAVLVSAEVART